MKIPKIKLVPSLTNESEHTNIGFKMAPEYVGKRFQLGGEPSWIQNKEDIFCDLCSNEMTFYAQLDSINDDIMIADCGLVYIFICFDCFTTKAILQSY